MNTKSEAEREFEKTWLVVVDADDCLWKFLSECLQPHELCGVVTLLQAVREANLRHGIAGVFYEKEETSKSLLKEYVLRNCNTSPTEGESHVQGQDTQPDKTQ